MWMSSHSAQITEWHTWRLLRPHEFSFFLARNADPRFARDNRSPSNLPPVKPAPPCSIAVLPAPTPARMTASTSLP